MPNPWPTLSDLLNLAAIGPQMSCGPTTSKSPPNPDKFYSQPLPTVASLTSLDPNILSGTLGTQGLSDEMYRLLQYLDLVSRVNAGQELAIDDFQTCEGDLVCAWIREARPPSLFLLRHSTIDQWQSKLISADRRVPSSGLVYHPSNGTRDKTTISACDPKLQVTTEAITTFQCNNCIQA